MSGIDVASAATQSVVQVGTIQTLRRESAYHKNIWILGNASDYTDRALLEYCEYTPYFGGRVERLPDGSARVSVYTD